jgi:hypothetical protein
VTDGTLVDTDDKWHWCKTSSSFIIPKQHRIAARIANNKSIISRCKCDARYISLSKKNVTLAITPAPQHRITPMAAVEISCTQCVARHRTIALRLFCDPTPTPEWSRQN